MLAFVTASHYYSALLMVRVHFVLESWRRQCTDLDADKNSIHDERVCGPAACRTCGTRCTCLALFEPCGLVASVLFFMQCELHTWNVVIRHTRYRDLAKSIWGAL